MASPISEIEFDLSDLEEFCKEVEEENAKQSEETNTSICTCGLPSTGQLIICDNPSCTITYFHQQCVGLQDHCSNWLCENCRNKDPLSSADTNLSGRDAGPSSNTAQMKYPKRRFSKTDVASQALEYGKAALNTIFTSPMFRMETPLTKKVNEVAKGLQDALDKEQVKTYFQKMSKKLWKKVASVVRGKRWTEDLRSEMWSQFHILRSDNKLTKLWSELLTSLNIECSTDVEVFLFQHLIGEVFQLILKDMMNRDMPVLTAVAPSTPMEESEEQALRYCSGYVPQKLLKKYKLMKSSKTAQQFCEVLASWSAPVEDEGESVIEFTTVWLEKQSRGGLFQIDDNVYTFFKSLEEVVRSHLHKENIYAFKQSDIQVTLFTKIQERHSVWKNWNNVCSSLPEQGKLKLFEEVVKCFLKMRCEAFLRVYVMIRKAREQTVTKKGKKA